jgi:hypothetical protein
VSYKDLPVVSQSRVTFSDSTWFRTHGLTRSFPAPDQVRARSDPTHPRMVVKLEELDLVVKFNKVTVSEAVCLRAVK